jgi:3,4-dihydroxy 2-butanone 4-phosphate synthase/GTP cyclohydrolase II
MGADAPDAREGARRARDAAGAHAEAACTWSLRGALLRRETRRVETAHGPFAAHVFLDLSARQPCVVLTRGDVRSPEPLLARIHSSCVTSETLGGCDCDCAGQLDAALAAIAAEGRGAVFYLLQEGRGAGIAAKARDRMIVQSSGHRITTYEAYDLMGLGRDLRRYENVSFAATLLGVPTSLRLLTNNPEKLEAIRREGLDVAEILPLHDRASAWNSHYLTSKSDSGHTLDAADGGSPAEPPAPVDYFEPEADPTGLLHMASYWLPVRTCRAASPAWFRLHLYLDPVSGTERVVLVAGPEGAASPLVRIERDALLDRFAPREGGSRHARWLAAARRLSRCGGCAVFLPVEVAGEAPVATDAITAMLVARHLAGRRGHLLVDDAGPDDDARAWHDALDAGGVALGRFA